MLTDEEYANQHHHDMANDGVDCVKCEPPKKLWEKASPPTEKELTAWEGVATSHESILTESELKAIEERCEKATVIPGEACYRINEDGEVFSYHPWRGTKIRILTQIPNSDGYASVRLTSLAGTRRHLTIHGLLARTFMPPCPKGMQIRHLDGNRENNSLKNLAWGTVQENALDRQKHLGNYQKIVALRMKEQVNVR